MFHWVTKMCDFRRFEIFVSCLGVGLVGEETSPDRHEPVATRDVFNLRQVHGSEKFYRDEY